jgi:hypothetical protein
LSRKFNDVSIVKDGNQQQEQEKEHDTSMPT